MNLKSGDEFYGTHADLLNSLGLRTKIGNLYNQYYKSTYRVDGNTYIWIMCLDGKERDGWINVLQDNNTIVEHNTDDKEHNIGITLKYRLVFSKNKKQYIFKGLYALQQGSTNQKRILKKISDEIDL